MRRWIRDLSARVKVSFYQAQSNTDDSDDKPFWMGTTEGFPKDLLRKCNHDRVTFSESNIPVYTPQAEEADDDGNALEVHGEQDGNSMETASKQPNAGDLGPRIAGKKGPRVLISRTPSPSKSSRKSFGPTD